MRDPLVLIELGAVLIGLSLVARMAGHLKISAVPLYLLAGLAFGEGGVFPLVTTGPFIELGAEIGLILLLFTLGLEYSARELVVTLRRRFRAGVFDVMLNFPPGFVAGLALGWRPVASAALGGVTYVSSSGIASKLLHDLGWTRRPEGRVVVSLLVLEDLAMAVYLPVLAGFLIVGGISLTGLIGAGVAVAGVIVVLLAAMRIDVGFTRFVFRQSDEALLFTILGLAILGAGVAELVQVSTAVGALLVGIGMSGPGTRGAHELIEPLRDFFAAMFFAFFGLSVDPSALPPVLVPAAVLAIVTGLTKFGSGYLIGRRASLDHRSSLRTAAVLIARGEFSIVIAVIVVASGFDRIGPLTAAYVLMLAMVGPLIVRIVDRERGSIAEASLDASAP